MRTPRIVAASAIMATFALVAAPAMASSTPVGVDPALDETASSVVLLDGLPVGSTTTIPTFDPSGDSAGAIGAAARLGDSAQHASGVEPAGRPAVKTPRAAPTVVALNPWRYDSNVSFYGPGFYGSRTACGLAYTTELLGVANRTLPCGTLVTIRNPANGRTITVPVIDRGPYVSGRTWDLSGAACVALNHCYTGPLYWKYG